MKIRKMKETDVVQVTNIEKENFSQPWKESDFYRACHTPEAEFLVAEEQGQVRGYIGMYQSFEEGEITNVAVHKAFWGQKIGTALVQALREQATVCGVEKIILEVRVSNASAIRVYENCGFEKISRRKNLYDFPQEDGYIMICQQEAKKEKC